MERVDRAVERLAESVPKVREALTKKRTWLALSIQASVFGIVYYLYRYLYGLYLQSEMEDWLRNPPEFMDISEPEVLNAFGIYPEKEFNETDIYLGSELAIACFPEPFIARDEHPD